MRSNHIVAALAVVACLSLASSATGELIEFSVTLDGDQADACSGTGSLATGSGTLTLDTDTGIVSYNLMFLDLESAQTDSHVHGPAELCADASILYPIVLGSPSIGMSPSLTAQQQEDMFEGRHYVNIHSSGSPAGEIRGQVLLSVPAVSEWGLIVMTLLVLAVGTIGFCAKNYRKAV